jgi:hypothetical protein
MPEDLGNGPSTGDIKMDLVDRYLNSVGFWLPSAQQDDILAELSEDLRSQIEDREAGLGRPLNEQEMVEVLKQCGDPMLVAGGFLPRQYLIGPPWFPLYQSLIPEKALIPRLQGTGSVGMDRGRPPVLAIPSGP